jgi:hypothetical protein
MVTRVLDLFSGSGSVNRYTDTLPGEFEVVSVDCKDGILGHHPTHIADILTWNYQQYPPDHFDLVWASPPCEQYSIARTTARTPRNLELADALSSKALEIIRYFTSTPKRVAYVIENPRTSMLWKREHMSDMPEAAIADYCKYSDYGFQKPTKFCCNYPLELKVCRKDSRCSHIMSPAEYLAVLAAKPYLAHKRKTGGAGACHRNNNTISSFSYATIARVPELLIQSIFEQLLPQLTA